jgi:IPT/TIG domain
MRYKHVSTSRPTAKECAEEMRKVLEHEAILCAGIDNSDGLMNELATLAEVCGCDLRRLMHRLQLHFCVEGFPDGSAGDVTATPVCREEEFKKESMLETTICIETVRPSRVSSESHSIISIKGKNFLRLKCNASQRMDTKVFVGDQLCPSAKIVDDSKILAVCPPLVRDANVDKFGMRKITNYVKVKSFNARFAPISLQSCHPGGSLLVSSTSFFSHTLVNDTSIGALSPCNLERAFPEEEDDSNVEFDDVESKLGGSLPSCLLNRKSVASRPTDFDDDEIQTAQRLLDEALGTTSTKGGEDVKSKPTVASDAFQSNLATVKDLYDLSMDCDLASDAALLDDYGGIPLLAGATPGFGYQFTPEGSGSNHHSSLKLHGDSTQYVAECQHHVSTSPKSNPFNNLQLALSTSA